jgi:integrase
VPTTKNGEYRTVRLAKDAQRALRRYWHLLERWECDNMRDRAEYVWTSTARYSAMTPNGIGQMISKRSKLAGVDVTARAFRRGLAVEWLKRGGSETYLRSVAGWKSPEMVKRYTAGVVSDEALEMHERLFG